MGYTIELSVFDAKTNSQNIGQHFSEYLPIGGEEVCAVVVFALIEIMKYFRHKVVSRRIQ